MASEMLSRVIEVQKPSEAAVEDTSFDQLIAASPVDNDSALADLIEADGRWRQQRGLPVTMERYLHAVPNLREHPVATDAAIDVSLRWLSGGSSITPEAVAKLAGLHPEFSPAIHEAAALAKAVWSTRGLQARVGAGVTRELPCDFGPRMADGQCRYQLQQLLGQGAFGQVYLALDRQLSEAGNTALVAIKIANFNHRSPWVRQKAIEEAAKVRRVNHRHVVTVHDRGVTEQDEDFTVYEYVDGGDLNTLLIKRKNLPLREAAAMMSRIARGVQAAHSVGVIHCDLKPGNIMLTAAGEPKVVDFGIAVQHDQIRTLSDAGGSEALGPIGNVAFISPEQYRGEEGALSAPSDIYALGGILYYMITGELPNGDTLEAIKSTHASLAEGGRASPPSLRAFGRDIDRDLDLICSKAMAVNPDHRYHSAAALADDLDRWLCSEVIPWTRPSVMRVIRLWATRKPALAASIALIALLVLGGSIAGARLTNLAQTRKLEAAIAQVKLEEHEKRIAAAKATAGKIKHSLQDFGTDYRLNTEAIVKIWVYEYLLGPQVLGFPDEQRSMWVSRISVFRNLVNDAHSAGRDGEFEPMLLASLLGFFLACDGDFEEAIPLMDANISRWSRFVPESDPWIDDLRSIRLAAEINRLAAFPTHTPEALAGVEDALQLAIDRQAEVRSGAPLHFLLLQSQVKLNGPTLLNRPAQAEELQQALDKFIGVKTPATRPASSASSQ